MTQDAVAYTWEIDGRRTLNPDVFFETAQANGFSLDRRPLIQIDCPRGAQAGKATLLFGKEDAAAIVARSGPQTITVRKWTQTVGNDGTMQWGQAEQYDFQGYYVLGIKDAFGVDENNVYIELADARHLMESTIVRKRYNVVRKLDPSEEYDPTTLVTTDTPFTYQQILDDLLGELTSLPTLTLPLSYPDPRNLVFDCTLADALDQLLASLCCILAYNPLAGTYRIVNLASAANYSTLTAAKNEGRLLEKANLTASSATLPDKVSIRPAAIVALTSNAKELPAKTNPIEIGTGLETILIDDHEFDPDTSRIPNAINAWYGEQNYLLNETYQGIVKQSPAEHLSNVRWYFDAGATRTRIENRKLGDIPWPKQPTLARTEDNEEAAKPAFMVQGVLGTRAGVGPEGLFPAWADDVNDAYVDSGSLVVLSPAPFTAFVPFSSCKNPHGLNGEEGDTFVAVLDPGDDDGKFILIAVYPKQATLFFKFASDRPTGLYDVECSVTVQSWRHSGGGPTSELKVYDTMGVAVNAKEDDYGYAEWNTDKQRWVIISAKHHATRILGHTNDSSDADYTWRCDGDIGFDGYIVNRESGFDVVIDAGWDFPGIGKKIWFELNPADGKWHAYQIDMECEDGT